MENNMLPSIFVIEGVDILGKSLLVEGLKKHLGHATVHHSGKPRIEQRYMNLGINELNVDLGSSLEQQALVRFQEDYFEQAFRIIAENVHSKIIFDRLHLGEMVYSPLYRKIIPNSIMQRERDYVNLNRPNGFDKTRLILLVEDFEKSCHFVSDGESFDDANRQIEQDTFIKAYNMSAIFDKRIICVTDKNGQFRPKNEILQEALSE